MIVAVAIAAFAFAAACAVVRVVLGPSLADRVVGLDVALVCLMGAVAVDAAGRGDPVALDLLAVIAIVGFTATVAASRFVEHEGRR